MNCSVSFDSLKKQLQPTAKHWSAADLDVKAEGRWLNFFEKKGGKRINKPRLVGLSCNVTYRAKKRDVIRKSAPIPVNWPLEVNYTAIRPKPMRKVRTKRVERNFPEDKESLDIYKYSECEMSPRTYEFRGNAPITSPLRLSSILVNEKRLKEVQKYETPKKTNYTVREPEKQSVSLFRRSLRRHNDEFVFNTEIEERAKSLYT